MIVTTAHTKSLNPNCPMHVGSHHHPSGLAWACHIEWRTHGRKKKKKETAAATLANNGNLSYPLTTSMSFSSLFFMLSARGRLEKSIRSSPHISESFTPFIHLFPFHASSNYITPQKTRATEDRFFCLGSIELSFSVILGTSLKLAHHLPFFGSLYGS